MRGESTASDPVDYYRKHAGSWMAVNALSSRTLFGHLG